jgi:hypothetical protein
MTPAATVLFLVADMLLVERHAISQSSAAYEHLGRVWRRRIGAHRALWSLLQ